VARDQYDYDDQLRRVPQAVKFIKVSEHAITPRSSYPGDAGYDLFTSDTITIPPGEWRDVPVGIRLQAPEGYWVRLVGRSSTYRRRGLLVFEGVVDNGYRGDIYFGCRNWSPQEVVIERGERVAQAIIHRVYKFDWIECDFLDESDRQGAGFGSTGA
jgi:deoxyuridine 5'-triphosphate nucleotidohydrolase